VRRFEAQLISTVHFVTSFISAEQSDMLGTR